MRGATTDDSITSSVRALPAVVPGSGLFLPMVLHVSSLLSLDQLMGSKSDDRPRLIGIGVSVTRVTPDPTRPAMAHTPSVFLGTRSDLIMFSPHNLKNSSVLQPGNDLSSFLLSFSSSVPRNPDPNFSASIAIVS
ncbi:ORF32 [Ictalurid herpesvirus 1]|uniref:Uncharacterized protein ORF32 n=1 Tax=Ictalurid herpesvirus 1 (strain Auburn) TaxID=766178 RepID=VG32_ICHVA|nr:ORF32 [Ictalurid herpesvirus 1]Q00100.1 RecName: Full=Uncharacterized protein ORF32 [Ictalurid herpesvirus 1 (strain Auburn)]AAA88135.1 ORF32 [Ictalurid herpesvirus 1]